VEKITIIESKREAYIEMLLKNTRHIKVSILLLTEDNDIFSRFLNDLSGKGILITLNGMPFPETGE
jgi:hypothetical protein